MRIDDTYNTVVFILRKVRNGFLSIDDFNRAAQRAVLEVFEYYFELYGANQNIHDAISIFKSKFTFSNSTSGDGIIQTPSDYAHGLLSTVFLFDNKRGQIKRNIYMYNESELNDALNSQIRPVNPTNPIGIDGSNKIELFPNVPMAGEIRYLRQPKTPKYAYTLSGRVITYDSANSQDIEFKDSYISKVIAKILSYSGVFLSDDKIVQYAELKDKEAA